MDFTISSILASLPIISACLSIFFSSTRHAAACPPPYSSRKCNLKIQLYNAPKPYRYLTISMCPFVPCDATSCQMPQSVLEYKTPAYNDSVRTYLILAVSLKILSLFSQTHLNCRHIQFLTTYFFYFLDFAPKAVLPVFLIIRCVKTGTFSS